VTWMPDVLRLFESAPVDGAGLTSLNIEPLRKIELRLFTFSRFATDRAGGKEYELHFVRVPAFRLTSFSLADRIVSHASVANSDLLEDFKRFRAKLSVKFDVDSLHHFRLTSVHGQLDILAESFCLALALGRLPRLGN